VLTQHDFLVQTTALQGVLTKFGILEIARTGKIALKRGEHLLEMGGWGDGVAKRAKERQNVNVGEDGAQVSTSGKPTLPSWHDCTVPLMYGSAYMSLNTDADAD